MKVKFKIQDPNTGTNHRVCVKGRTMSECYKMLAARLILMGVSHPERDGIPYKVIKK